MANAITVNRCAGNLAGMPVEILDDNMAEWVDRARALGPLLVKHHDYGERERRTAPPVIDALRDGRFFRMWLPKAFGGEELDAETGFRVLEELAQWDASTAWCAGVCSGVAPLAEYLPPSVAREIWGVDGTGLLAGNTAVPGHAIRTDGGYLLSGRFPFGSAGNFVDWLTAPGIVLHEGQPVPTGDGQPEVRLLFLRKSECQIMDNWHTLGLRGTASNDYLIRDVFVPAERSIPLTEFATGPRAELGGSPTLAYPQPFYTFAVIGFAGLAAGIARAAIDTFRQLALNKTPTATLLGLADHHTIQEKLGRAEAALGAGRSYMLDTVRRFEESGRGMGTDWQARFRLAGAFGVEKAAEAVTLMYLAGGGSSTFESCPLAQHFRDISMLTQHVACAATISYETVGKYLFDGELVMRR